MFQSPEILPYISSFYGPVILSYILKSVQCRSHVDSRIILFFFFFFHFICKVQYRRAMLSWDIIDFFYAHTIFDGDGGEWGGGWGVI